SVNDLPPSQLVLGPRLPAIDAAGALAPGATARGAKADVCFAQTASTCAGVILAIVLNGRYTRRSPFAGVWPAAAGGTGMPLSSPNFSNWASCPSHSPLPR